MIARRYVTTFSVKRMAWSGDSSGEVVTTDSLLGHFQQASAELAGFLGEAYGKLYTVWCAPTASVLAGDTLTVSSGSFAGTYSVKAVREHLVGSEQHREITAVRDV